MRTVPWCTVRTAASGGAFDLGGGSLVSVSQDGANAALLLENGQVCTAVLLDKDLNVQYSGNVPAANQILRRGQNFYLLTDSGVECFATDGVYQWGTGTFRPSAGTHRGQAAAGAVRQHGAADRSAGANGFQRPVNEGKTSIFAGKVIFITGKTRYVQESVISFLISYVRWSGWC